MPADVLQSQNTSCIDEPAHSDTAHTDTNDDREREEQVSKTRDTDQKCMDERGPVTEPIGQEEQREETQSYNKDIHRPFPQEKVQHAEHTYSNTTDDIQVMTGNDKNDTCEKLGVHIVDITPATTLSYISNMTVTPTDAVTLHISPTTSTTEDIANSPDTMPVQNVRHIFNICR